MKILVNVNIMTFVEKSPQIEPSDAKRQSIEDEVSSILTSLQKKLEMKREEGVKKTEKLRGRLKDRILDYTDISNTNL